uniref:NAD(P)-binding domain-containing protein n=1 Tax=Trieres chinensis TaxID=1514140 RepID=A0A7S1ZP53_TRICV|mmetsp:Transcript_30297/g.61787  ORF Transcript_30297/g.61787 Transcript_30297/m.61787 type:complete len:253 (+) Transcript_30297:57-815(+)|eukprot:CAMPEP_0183309580 /NCGR_PEP_ID=MMETSP0160_2-20130417/25429_1 /TAXON_ID=2839 ORGANISM="Odontella Sinensis, Strain Grunow 1884" /NCGR_SAMPLE_ID=MMETSP0160_2 /ASSEMBLY_ACC=CAM_ASM_000250 /LENGTH=252 /DNA_ID=CAMNT_0025473633 /DNA_START=37 /DNA_END=795 /DNA_ORIENTATION=+
MSAVGKKAIVAGATGSVGRLVVQTLVGDSRVEHVTAVVRKEVPSERAKELWGETNGKVTQLAVDFKKLKDEAGSGEMTDAAKSAFDGSDAFITCLGVYSSKASEKEMDEIEGSFNAALAKIAKDAGAKRGAYLSGDGVKQPTLEGKAFAKFGRAKGRAEETLAGIFTEGHLACRPGAIFERPGPPVYGAMEKLFDKWPFEKMKKTNMGIVASDIAKAMVQGSLFDDDKTVEGNTIWPNKTLKEVARRYESNM